MTDKLPPLPPDQIRIVLLLPSNNMQTSVDFKVSGLPYLLTDAMANAAREVSMPVPAKGTAEGSVIARAMLAMALEDGENSDHIACLIAMWLCLYGTPHLPGLGLQLKELEEAAGHGVLRVYDLDELYSWQFDFTSKDGRCGGRREVPRQTHWSKSTAGTA